MFTLIKREIQDHIVYFIGATVFSVILTGILISLMYDHPMRIDMVASRVTVGNAALIIIIFGLFAMGATQMYTDRIRRISAFISTLSVNKSRILLARIITGILVIVTLLVPLAIAAMIYCRLFTPPVPWYSSMALEVFTGTFLTAFACYCIGLQARWGSGKVGPTFGGLGLTCILVSLVLVKGFGLHTIVILVLFIVVSLILTWQTFKSTSL